ncbi:MAG: hypothetical protein ACE5EV_02330, partial [Gaiellales bacterium]
LTNHTPAAATAPDALDRYLANTQTSRTPDMIGRLLTQTPSPTNSSAPQAAPATRTAPPLATTSFDWAAASIGAGTTLGLILLAAATVTAIRRRTRIAPLS